MAPRLPPIEIGYAVFLSDGAGAFGAVRDIVPNGKPVLLVNVEGGGDVSISLDAIVKVAAKRVVVRWDGLEESVQNAIRHAQDVEDFPPEDEDEVDLEPASEQSEEEGESEREIFAEGRADSPPDELPGRDRGSRWFLPHQHPSRRRGET